MTIPQAVEELRVDQSKTPHMAPPASEFPVYPTGWYLLGADRDMRRGTLSQTLWGRRLVGYRTDVGQPVVLDAQCCHLGADLGRGRVIGDAIECPFHNWRFGPDGVCQHIPSTDQIPRFARQTSYPVVRRHGLWFVYRGSDPHYELPFFPDCRPEDFKPARPFQSELSCRWYMVGANAFDVQHFRAAHDRQLLDDPVVSCPTPYARQVRAGFRVASGSLQDRMTRLFAGERANMTFTSWSGTLVFATATFRKTRSYGMVAIQPLESGGVRVRTTIFVPRSKNPLARALIDPLSAFVRRIFIREFMRSDAERLEDARYNPQSLIDSDRVMSDYFRWLSVVSHGRPYAGDE